MSTSSSTPSSPLLFSPSDLTPSSSPFVSLATQRQTEKRWCYVTSFVVVWAIASTMVFAVQQAKGQEHETSSDGDHSTITNIPLNASFTPWAQTVLALSDHTCVLASETGAAWLGCTLPNPCGGDGGHEGAHISFDGKTFTVNLGTSGGQVELSSRRPDGTYNSEVSVKFPDTNPYTSAMQFKYTYDANGRQTLESPDCSASCTTDVCSLCDGRYVLSNDEAKYEVTVETQGQKVVLQRPIQPLTTVSISTNALFRGCALGVRTPWFAPIWVGTNTYRCRSGRRIHHSRR